jgi:hypothetical protein
MPKVHLETQNLLIRELTWDDLVDIHEIKSNEKVVKFLT